MQVPFSGPARLVRLLVAISRGEFALRDLKMAKSTAREFFNPHSKYADKNYDGI